MAFFNEKLTREERELFRQRDITNPLDYMNRSILVPEYWTIDRTRKSFIFEIGVQRDWPDETVFFYQLRDVSMIISVRHEYLRENTVVYSINNTCYSPLDGIEDVEFGDELKTVLKQALEQFKTQGTPDAWNMSTNVICDF